MGVDDGEHDPGECTVWDVSVRPVVDVASYSGFLGEYGLGVLSAGMAKHYEEALVDPDTTGGLGGGFLGGLRSAKYGRIVNHRTGKQEMSRVRVGFVQLEPPFNSPPLAIQRRQVRFAITPARVC